MSHVTSAVLADLQGSPFADLLGWCLALLLLAFAMIGPLRRDQRAAQAYLITVLLHIAAAAIYVYFPGVLPIRNDSHVFHRYAVQPWLMADWSFAIGSAFFKEYLAQVYRFVGSSWFFGAILSICAFALSVLVLVRFMEILNIKQGKGLVILMFGAIPTSVFYGSVPMREPYQVLFFMLGCYSMLRFRLTNQPLNLVASIIFSLLMGMLHRGLILYAPFLIIIMLLVRLDHSDSRSTGRVYIHRFAAVALATGFLVWIPGAAQKLEGVGGTEVLLMAITGDGLTEFTMEHRDEEALTKGRTAYGVALNTFSPVQFAYSVVMISLYYMFTPFPWQVRNLMDIYAFGEVILRIACLIAICRVWCRGGPVRPQIVTLLMVVYFSMAFVWAAGTTNYGTATRHHMIHQWILLLLGVPALVQMWLGLAGSPTGQGTGPARFARSRGSARVGPHIPHLKPLIDTSFPVGLGIKRRPVTAVQRTGAAPRLLAGGRFRAPRRLPEE